jgi:hypothetical protein
MGRLALFECIGVELPSCSPAELEEHEFSEIEIELITTKDPALGPPDRLLYRMREDRVPIVEPISPLHMMRVSASEKVPLGRLEETLSRLQHLGVRSGVADLPDSLRDYIPSRTETDIASRLRHGSLSLALLEHAFGAQLSCGYVCDLVSPWCAWLLADHGADVDYSLTMIRENASDLVPSYSDVSFYAAAASLGESRGNALDLSALAILAAQANASINQAAGRAMRMQALLLADGIDLQIPTRGISDERPDSRWVMVALPEKAVAGAHAELAGMFGVDEELRSLVAKTLRI